MQAAKNLQPFMLHSTHAFIHTTKYGDSRSFRVVIVSLYRSADIATSKAALRGRLAEAVTWNLNEKECPEDQIAR